MVRVDQSPVTIPAGHPTCTAILCDNHSCREFDNYGCRMADDELMATLGALADASARARLWPRGRLTGARTRRGVPLRRPV